MGTRKTTQPRRGAAKAAEAEPTTVRLNLRRSVGRGGFYYGPGWADVPTKFAKSLIASGASTEGSEESDAPAGEASSDAKGNSADEASTRSEESETDTGTETQTDTDAETETEQPAARKRSAKPAKSARSSKSRRK